jgi:hypothetical protein
MPFKYVKHGVKRKHDIIEGILPMLEKIAGIEGVKKVVPAGISYSPKRSIKGPAVKYQRDTITGFKLLAQSKGSIQEVFVIVEESKKEDVRKELKAVLHGNP